jgi:hypothetical protein
MNIVNIIKEEVGGYFINEATASEIRTLYYKNIPEDIFQKLISSDPTSGSDKLGKFSKWILKQYQKNGLKLEDLYKVNEYLRTFIKYNDRIEDKNINNYKTINDLYSVVAKFDEPDPINIYTKESEKRISEKLINDGEAEIFYNDNKLLVVIPKTRGASCHFGKKTQWCTARDDDNNQFDYYNKRGRLYTIINKQNPEIRHLLHIQEGQFMDIDDEPAYCDSIIPEDLFKKIMENEGLKYVEIDLSDHEMMIEIVDAMYCDYRGGRGDYISKETVSEVLKGTFYPDIYYNGMYDDLYEYLSIDEVKNTIMKTLEERGGTPPDVDEMDDKELFEYMEDYASDIVDNLKSIYGYASDGKYMSEFYDAIRREIKDIDVYAFNLAKNGLSTESLEDGDCFKVKEPHYGFDSYVDDKQFLEYFKEYYEF